MIQNLSQTIKLIAGVLFVILGFAATASAHGIHDTPTFSVLSGFAHPLSGLDHILAMIAIGIWSTQHEPKVTRWMPAVFAVVMIHGAFMASAGHALPAANIGTAASVAILGVLLAATVKLRLPVAFFLPGIFAIFYGFSHGVELAAKTNYVEFGAGLIAATIALQLIGVVVGNFIKQYRVPTLARGFGI